MAGMTGKTVFGVAALGVMLAGCAKGPRGDAKILAASVGQDGVLSLTVSFEREPLGDAAEMSVQLGSMALEGGHVFRWERLAELDEDPATDPARPPAPGLRAAFRIPLALKGSFKTKPGHDIDVSVGVYWGAEDGLPVRQDGRTISLEEFYKKDYGIQPLITDKQAAAEAEYEKPGAPPIAPETR